jgi:hypothetical protein
MGREVAGFLCSQNDRKDYRELTFDTLIGRCLVYVSGHRRCLSGFSNFKQECIIQRLNNTPFAYEMFVSLKQGTGYIPNPIQLMAYFELLEREIEIYWWSRNYSFLISDCA